MADRCARVILEEGRDLLGICTPSSKLTAFAKELKIPCTNSVAILKSWMEKKPCDFLFSVVNSKILSKEIIQLARQFCINFHNAPLPKYAGVHATSWAILNGEKLHGATWHVLEEEVDTGNILKQCVFKIDDYDTSFSLNVKCIENAMPLFSDLLKELANGSYTRTKQDLSQRSYYSFFQKPRDFGVISWSSATAEEIYAMERGLNFSEYANKLCLPKFIYNDTVFFAKGVKVSDEKSNAESGTVVEISEEHLKIATTTNDIIISQISDIDNRNYEALAFAEARGIAVGQSLTSLSPAFLDKLREHGEKLAKSESYWVKTITEANSVNFLSLNPSKNNPTIKEQTVFSGKIAKLLPKNVNSETALITMFLLYLYRLNNYDDYSVGYKSQYAENATEDIHDFFAEVAPINLSFSAETDFASAYSSVSKLLDTTKIKDTYSKDIKLRYPQLSDNTLSLPIVISTSKPTRNDNRCLCFVINNDSIRLYFPDDLDELNAKIIENMPGHLNVFINGILRDKTLKVKDAPLLTESEKHLLIEEYNDTTTDYPRDSSIAEIFEEQVLKYPNNIAVKHGNDYLTYDELNQKANQLASHLIN
ncbi:MAG: hypothetical protein LBL99_03530, partial [Holosporaceae bacterium]|nr:hypothetical protein [Holosporaceae bacterium]